MVSEEEFIKIIDSSFWQHITKNTYVPFENAPSRTEFLKSLYSSILNHTYFPGPPREYVVSNKHNQVARIVPAFLLKDYCIYYFCVKRLENELSRDRVDGTFGAFRLSGEIKKKEENSFDEFLEISSSVSPFAYNKKAWVKEWRDFQKKIYAYFIKKKYKFYIEFDIANFYDCIDLLYLERKIRLAVNKCFAEEIDLLFYFLKTWNTRFNKYAPQSVGLPQDEVGDCSRVLANFYLQTYDQQIHSFTKSKDSLYFRYSDDQIIMTNSQPLMNEILFFCSKELMKIHLNINSGKVEKFSRKSFHNYWAFRIFELLENPKNHRKIKQAIRLYLSFKKNNVKFRQQSVLRRILYCDLTKLDVDLKNLLFAEYLNNNYLANGEARELLKLFEKLDTGGRLFFKKRLLNLSKSIPFNKYHYVLLALCDKGVIDISHKIKLLARIEHLKF